MDRRRVLKAGAAAAAATLFQPAYLRAQSNKKLSILTWNIADQEALFKEEFAEFQAAHPGVEIEWLDKKGPDLPAFYQTQLVAGTAPDIVDLQGELWVEWAANGALLDYEQGVLWPYIARDVETRQRFWALRCLPSFPRRHWAGTARWRRANAWRWGLSVSAGKGPVTY